MEKTLADEIIEAGQSLNNIQNKMSQIKRVVFEGSKELKYSCFANVAYKLRDNLARLPKSMIIRFFGKSLQEVTHIALYDTKTKEYILESPSPRYKDSPTYDYTIKQLKGWK